MAVRNDVTVRGMSFQTSFNFYPFLPDFCVLHVFQKSITFISFPKKMWRYDDVTTGLRQNQMISIAYSIFLRCINKVLRLLNGGFYRQQRLISFETKHKKQILRVSCFPIVVVEQYYHISSQKWLFTKILVGLLNHPWYKPKRIKLFFSKNSLG